MITYVLFIQKRDHLLKKEAIYKQSALDVPTTIKVRINNVSILMLPDIKQNLEIATTKSTKILDYIQNCYPSAGLNGWNQDTPVHLNYYKVC